MLQIFPPACCRKQPPAFAWIDGEVGGGGHGRSLSRSATAASDFSDDRPSARQSSRRIASLRLGIFGCERRQSSTSAKIGPSSGNRTTAVCSCMKAPPLHCAECAPEQTRTQGDICAAVGAFICPRHGAGRAG